MAENPTLKKMKLKPGARAAVVGAPPGYLKSLKPLPPKAAIGFRAASTGFSSLSGRKPS